MSLSSKILTRTVREKTAPTPRRMRGLVDHGVKAVGLEHVPAMRELLKELLRCCTVQAHFDAFRGAQKGITDPDIQKTQQAEFLDFGSIPNITRATAGRIRSIILDTTPGQRRKFYEGLRDKQWGLLLKIIDRAMTDGENLSQDELAEAARFRLMAWLPPHLYEIIDPLMKEWKYEQKRSEVRILFPDTYSKECAKETAMLAQKKKIQSMDIVSLEYILAHFGASPAAFEEIWVIMENIEMEERAKKEVRLAPVPEDITRVSKPVSEKPEKSTKNASTDSPKKQYRKVSAAMANCQAYVDTLFASTTPLAPHVQEEIAEAEDVVGNNAARAFKIAKEALAHNRNGTPEKHHELYTRIARAMYEDLVTTGARVQSLYSKAPGKGDIRERATNLLRSLCSIERRAYDTFKTVCGPETEGKSGSIYAALRQGITGLFLRSLDDSEFSRNKSKSDNKDRRVARTEIVGAIREAANTVAGMQEESDPVSCQAFVREICTAAERVLPLLNPPEDVSQDEFELPEYGLLTLGAACPAIQLTQIMKVGSSKPITHSTSYTPSKAEQVHITVTDSESSLQLVLPTLGKPPCLPSTYVPLDAVFNPASEAVKEAYGHAKIARIHMKFCRDALGDTQLTPLFPAMKQLDVTPHLVSIMDFENQLITQVFIFDEEKALALGIQVQPIPNEVRALLEEVQLDIPQNACVVPRIVPSVPTRSEIPTGEALRKGVRDFFTKIGVTIFPLKKAESLLAKAGVSLERGRKHGKAIDTNGRARAVGNRIFTENQMPKDFLIDLLLREQHSHLEPIGDLQAFYEWIQEDGLYENL